SSCFVADNLGPEPFGARRGSDEDEEPARRHLLCDAGDPVREGQHLEVAHAFRSRAYRPTVSRWTPSSRAIRRWAQPSSRSGSICCSSTSSGSSPSAPPCWLHGG